MEFATVIRKRSGILMKKNIALIGNVIQLVSPEEAVTYRDGEDGWTILEVLCHLRDFDQFFFNRAQMMLEQDYPTLPVYDHNTIAIEHSYNEQDMDTVYEQLVRSRQEFLEFFKSLDDEEWEKSGVHPERGHFTMTDAIMQVGLHDVDHLEQMTRILAEGRANLDTENSYLNVSAS